MTTAYSSEWVKGLPSELTNTVGTPLSISIVYVHRNEAHFTYIYVVSLWWMPTTQPTLLVYIVSLVEGQMTLVVEHGEYKVTCLKSLSVGGIFHDVV